MDQLVTVCGRKFRNGLLASSIPSLVHNLLKGVDVHDFAFSGQHQSPGIIFGSPADDTIALLYCRAVIGQFFFVHLRGSCSTRR